MSQNKQSYECPTLTVESVAAEQGFATSVESITVSAYEQDGEF